MKLWPSKADIRRWLGVPSVDALERNHKRINDVCVMIEQLSIMGVDPSFHKSPTQVCIVSRLNGGRVEIIDAPGLNVEEMRQLIGHLKARYGTGSRNIIFDQFPGNHNEMNKYIAEG